MTSAYNKVAAALGLLTFSALGADPMSTARAYSDAFVDGDCLKMERLSSESLRRRSGGADGLAKFLCEFRAGLTRDGTRLTEQLLEPSEPFIDGLTRLVFVPIRRTLKAPKDEPSTSSWPYVVHSSDGGSTWHVLDLGCVDERWVKEIAPAWKGVPALPSSQ